MAKLTIRLFGTYEALFDGQTLAGARSPMRQALLAYLIAEPPVAHPREALMTLLWPGLPSEAAQTNLRQLIFQLRGAIPEVDGPDGNRVPFLLSERQTVRMNPAATFEADVARYDALLNTVRGHGHADSATCRLCHSWLEEAVSLNRGAFLADLYLEDSIGFEDWAHRRREAYRRQQLDALSTLAGMELQAGNYVAAQANAERQLAIDDLDERATRQLMEALAGNGRRREALAVYATAEQRLRAELGMSPAARTAALADQIRGDQLAAVAPKPAAVRGYQLLDEIGAGAFGVVHRAYQPVIGREVAVKIIRPRYANHPDFIRRFEAEAQTVARLEHPHIVPLYDYWREPDNAYLVMRWLRGGNLEGRLAQGPLPLADTARIIDQLAAALQTAHRQHIIHRDVKAANILLDEDQNAYLSDFSVAKDLLTEEEPFGLHGSPEYISPEQLLREALSPQTDQYSLGIVLYQMLTGASPFAQDSPVDTLRRQILNLPLPRVASQVPGMPGSIDDVIQRATAKKPGDRFPDMLALARAFGRAVGALGVAVGDGRQAAPAAAAESEPAAVVNPYKGLRAFQESDAATFFGREALVEHLVDRLQEEPADRRRGRFLAVVGPSGSGKSSVVKAGLLPALRDGALPGADRWFITEMTPSRQPLHELELALLRVAVDPPADLLETLGHDTRGLIRVLERILPQEGHAPPQLLLVIDQFEELFTLTDDSAARQHFLDSLLAALAEPDSRLRVIATLRADFYDRPLGVVGLGELLRHRTEVVLPLSPAELERAITRPAALAGVTAEPALTAAMTADVADGPGTLPLMQYALTELFDRRDNETMTLDAYRAIGGVSGALGRRAEELYDSLDAADREAARQLFLRLITLGEGIEDTRRRATRAELEELELGIRNYELGITEEEGGGDSGGLLAGGRRSAIAAVIDTFGQYRLLTFDRDPVTRGPTVEVAHEALLREWPRLRTWLEESRADVRLQRLLAGAAAEWLAAGRDDSYLLRGSRLKQFEDWAGETGLSLTEGERAFLAAGVALRQRREAEEEARRGRELETAHKLAETERQRADEQATSAGRLRRRAAWLAGAVGLALVLAMLAFGFARSSAGNATLAATREAQAQANAAVAQTAEARALDQGATAEAERVRAEAGAAAALAAKATAAAEADVRATAEAIAVQEREVAEEQSLLATSRELALASRSTLDIDAELSLLLALRALETAETKDAIEALHRAVQSSRTLRAIDNPEPAWDTVVQSPDGPLPTAVSETDITIWDPETMQPLYVLPGAGFDPELYPRIHMDQAGERLHLIQMPLEDDWIDYRVWTLEDEQRVISQTLPIRLDVRSFPPFSPDGQLLAVNYDDGTVTLLDLNTGQQVALPSNIDDQLDNSSIFPPVFDPDGDRLAVYYAIPGQVSIWDVPASFAAGSGQRLTSFAAPDLADTGGLIEFAFVDETTVAAGSAGGLLQIWDLNDTSAPLATQSAHNAPISDIEVSNDRTKIATSSATAVKIWGVPRFDLLLTLPTGVDNAYEVYFSLDDTELITVDYRGRLRIWDARPYPLGETVSFEQAHINTISHEMQLSPDGRQLAITSDFTPASLWDTATGELLKLLADGEGATYGAGYSPDGTRLATVGQDDRIRIWDLANNEVELSFLGESSGVIQAWKPGIFDVAYSPDGSRLVTAGGNGVAKVWDAQTGEELLTLIRHSFGLYTPVGLTAGLYDVVYSPDGQLIATAGADNEPVRVWNAETGEEMVVIELQGNLTWALAFSPDSSRLAIGTWEAGAQVWDTTTGEKIYSFDQAGDFVPDLAYTPDGQHIITAGARGLKVWRAEDGEEVLTLTDDYIRWLAISPDGRTVYGLDSREVVRGFTLQLEDTIALAHERLTRWWRPEECLAYLHTEECPPAPQKFATED